MSLQPKLPTIEATNHQTCTYVYELLYSPKGAVFLAVADRVAEG
ncbi:MAG TPA: hypothetical protein VNW92_30090 [Polyangiaceae bacterium]|nr:hypothetical protein [Polyangiaceae bacterium]